MCISSENNVHDWACKYGSCQSYTAALLLVVADVSSHGYVVGANNIL